MQTEQIIRESRAKIMWGEPRQSVFEYMQASGLGDKEASAYLDALFRERAADIRRTGIKKILIGSFWVVVLVAYLAFAALVGVIALKLLALAIVAAVVGVWKILEGIGYIVKPSSESGDLSNLSE
jgi:hypothetical protein